MQVKNRLFPFLNISAMVFLIFFHGVNNFIWLKINKCPPTGAPALHLVSSLKYLDIISHPGADIFLRLAKVDFFYPPLFPFISSIFALLFGKAEIVFLMTNVLFMSGIFICLYLIGYKIGDVRIGILAAYLLSLYPVFSYISRIFIIDIALCFMVVASILALIYSEGFKIRKHSVMFGILFGFGFLTKQTYIIFILGSVVVLFADSYLRGNALIRRKIVRNLLFGILIGLSLCFFWYYSHLKQMFPVLLNAVTDSSLVPYDIKLFSLRSLFFYAWQLLDSQILLLFFLVFIFAVAFIIFNKIKNKYITIFLAWILIAYFLLTFFPNKFFYYTLPYLPAIALISAYALLKIKRAHLRRILIVLVLAFGFLQFFMASYFNGTYVKKYYFELRKYKIRYLPFHMTEMITKYYPVADDSGMGRIIQALVKNSSNKMFVLGISGIDPNMVPKITGRAVGDNYISTDFDALTYALMLEGISCKTIRLQDMPSDKASNLRIDLIISADRLENINTYGIKPERYLLLEEFIMPDLNKIYLYKTNY